MSRRIEIELTSKRSETEWTWRAAGAKQPKGVLESSVLFEGAKVGDIVRADAEFEIEGITIVGATPVAGKRSASKSTGTIEITGSNEKFEPVTQQLVGKGERGGRGGRDGGGRDGGDRRPRRDGDRPGGPRSDRPSGPGGNRGERPSGPRGEGSRGPRPERTGDSARREPRTPRPARPEAPSFKRLTPKDDNRKAVLDSVAPEARPIAEQVLRGGIPSVRQAIDAENTKAKAEGRPEVNGPALIAMAEELLPQLKSAEWMDRAVAAKAQVNEISVRDLRSVVTGADAVARTDDARLLASELREALERRTDESRETWVKEITTCLAEGRTVRALRLSARPPDAQTKFPPEILEQLKTAAEEAMSPETAPDRWVTLLDAVANSPVRRSVEPKGLPAEPGEELMSAAKQAAGRIPALAKQLGVTMPPPPRRLPPKPASSSPAPAPAAAAEEAPVASAPTGALDAGVAGNEPAEPEAPKAEAPKAEVEAAETADTESVPEAQLPEVD